MVQRTCGGTLGAARVLYVYSIRPCGAAVTRATPPPPFPDMGFAI